MAEQDTGRVPMYIRLFIVKMAARRKYIQNQEEKDKAGIKMS